MHEVGIHKRLEQDVRVVEHEQQRVQQRGVRATRIAGVAVKEVERNADVTCRQRPVAVAQSLMQCCAQATLLGGYLYA